MTETLHAPLREQSITDQAEVANQKPNYLLRRLAAASLVPLAALGVHEGAKAAERIVTPIDYSSETTTYSVKENEGLDAVTSYVAGINTVDFQLVKEHIRTMPENADVFADKVVNLGETFIIPAEVRKH